MPKGVYIRDPSKVYRGGPPVKHGYAKKGKIRSEYRIYNAMKDRCYRIKCLAYKDYGERGITVCDRWLESF